MTLTFSMHAHQGRNGSPINATLGMRSDDSSDSYPYWGLGVKTSSGAPGTFAALARWDGESGINDAFWDRSGSRYRGGYAAGTQTLYTDQQQAFKRKALDADYAAGRYLWLVAFASATPGGSDVPVATAGPYLIR